VEAILVVDDDVLIRISIAGYLRECGFTVWEAGDAEEAVTVLEAVDEIDLVFSDVQMPGPMDGFGLARWVRANRPGVQMILASGVARASEAAADVCEESFLQKPYQHQQVADRIRALMAGRAARLRG
jgi:CheY-like chemotaxis protein